MSRSGFVIGGFMLILILLLNINGIMSSQDTIISSVLIFCYGLADNTIDLIKKKKVVGE